MRAIVCSAMRRARPDASHVLTAHTLDDQAETVLIRLLRGSGITGLAAMRECLTCRAAAACRCVRPLLDIPKARLIATLRGRNIPFADDPTNRDPRFTRARLRALMPRLAGEGLDACASGAAGAAARRAELRSRRRSMRP